MKKRIGAVALVLLPACGGNSTSTPSTPTTPTTTLAAAPAPVETTVRYSSQDVPRDIPNNTRTTSVLTIADRGTILDVSVDVSISHTWRGDVDVYVRRHRSPRGNASARRYERNSEKTAGPFPSMILKDCRPGRRPRC